MSLSRLSALTARLPSGTAVIQNPLNLRYFLNTGVDTGVLLLCGGKPYFITDSRYSEAAKRDLPREIAVLCSNRFYDETARLCREHGLNSVLVERGYQTLLAADQFADAGLTFVPGDTLDTAIGALRIIKSDEELDCMRRAQAITDDAFSYALTLIKPGLREAELAFSLEFFMRRQGAQGVSFDLIAISGENTSLPHGIPGDRKIAPGDFVTMDIGCKVDGYCSDMTRTVAVGFATDEMRQVYDTVLRAQEAALAAVRPGVTDGAVDKAARDVIEAAGYGGCFGHGTGHGVGLYIHEAPRCSPGQQTVLCPGMVTTVEPGIYLEGRFGVRIEDMVAVTETGCENLTRSDKRLIVLETA